MGGSFDTGEEAGLWRRWRAGAAADDMATPDDMSLASYAEDRLDAAARDRVEQALASFPDAAGDVLAARLALKEEAQALPSEAALARALALVAPQDPKILPFRRKAPRWRAALAWGGMAACIAATGVVGFVLGNQAYTGLAASQQRSLSQDLFDPPGDFFNGWSEESGT